jgi:transcriptional regulator with XRE-family HTH domain
MSDEIDAAASSVDAQASTAAEVPLPPTSFGARLKWEREQAGLTVSDVAARLRLHPNQIRAIEQESLAALPEPAYVRGFVRSYARIVNADPVPLLDDLSTKFVPVERSVVDGMAQPRDYSPVRAAAHEQASRRFVVLGAAADRAGRTGLVRDPTGSGNACIRVAGDVGRGTSHRDDSADRSSCGRACAGGGCSVRRGGFGR